MKKQILISLISISSVLTMNAQTQLLTSPIYYNSSNNKVGIGIPIPQSALHIIGNQNLSWSDIYTDANAGTGLVTIGDKGGNGSLFINTPTVNNLYPAGLAIDGSYNATTRISLINIKAFGTKYQYYSSNLAFYTSSGTSLNEAMRINESCNIGIGTTPSFRFHIRGGNANSDLMTLGNTSTSNFALTSADGGAYGLFAGISNSGRAWLQVGRYDSNTAYDLILQASGGNVGIGTTIPSYKLDVLGTIRAQEVKVNLGGTLSDFVFAPNYPLRSLSEIEKYVKANSHLPEIPSAAEVAKNGLSLGEMQNKLLQKVEELTLYTIEQDKKIQEQDWKNAELQKQIDELKKLIKQK